ncbi:MAG: nuclear transport factor 2 family protein [Betaproteobacteria bacterium]
MSKAKLQAASVAGSAADIEAAFYEALQTADIEKLMACWADEDEVVCVHPGGARLVGLRAIRAAFESLFSNGSVRAHPQRVQGVESLASAVHSVVERIEVMTPQGPQQAYVIATNVYHKTAQGWRLVAHHASPGTLSEVHEANDTPQVLH